MRPIYRRTAALLLGVGISVVLFFFLEGASYLLLQSPYKKALKIPLPELPRDFAQELQGYSMSVPTTSVKGALQKFKPPVYASDEIITSNSEVRRVQGAYLGHQPGQTFWEKSHSPTLGPLFHVTSTIDKFGWRVSRKNPRAHFHFIVIGGSFTYGDGVENEETLPSMISTLSSEYQGYNMGMSGSSVAGTLARMQVDENWNGGVESPQGVAIYLFVSDHIRRAQSLWNGLGKNSVKLPYFEDLGGDHFHFKGSMGREFPLWANLVQFFLQTNIVKLLRLKRIAIWSSAELDRYARMIVAVRKEYFKKFPQGRFYFVFYPDNDVAAVALAPYLEQYKIPFLYYDLSTLYAFSSEQPFIYGNGHPSPSGHRAFAELLIKDLRLDHP